MDKSGSSSCNGVPDFVSEDSDIHIYNESTIVYEVSDVCTQMNCFMKQPEPILESSLLDLKEVVEDHSVPEISVVSESNGFVTHDWTGPLYEVNENNQGEFDDSISCISKTDEGLDQTLVCSTPIHQKCSVFVTRPVVDAEKRFYNGCFQQELDCTFDECTVLSTSGGVLLSGKSNIELEHIHVLDLSNKELESNCVFKQEHSSKLTRKLCDLNTGDEQDGKSLEGSSGNITDSDIPLAKRRKIDNDNTNIIHTAVGMTKENVKHQGGRTLCSFLAPCENDEVGVSAVKDKGSYANKLETSAKENVKNNSHGAAEPNVLASTADNLKINETKGGNLLPGGLSINECNEGREIDFSHSPSQQEHVDIRKTCPKLAKAECDSESDVIVDCIIENNLSKDDFDNTWRRDLTKHCEIADSMFEKLSNLRDKQLENNCGSDANLGQVENGVSDLGESCEQSSTLVDKSCTLMKSLSTEMVGLDEKNLESSILESEFVVVDTADITAMEGNCGLKNSNFSDSICKSDLRLPDTGVSNVTVSVDPVMAEDSDSDVEIIAVVRTPNTLNKQSCLSTSKEESVKAKQGENSTAVPLKLNFADTSAEANVKSVTELKAGQSTTPDQLLDVKSKDTSESTEAINEVEMKKPDLQPFKSDNPQENIDNEDPEWDYLRKLENDEARYKAVRACWQSQVIPNPSRDLTYHSFRKKRLENESIPSTEPNNTRGLKRPASEQLVPKEAKRARTTTVSCTTPTDNKINLLQQDYIKKVAAINNEYRNKKSQLELSYWKARDIVANDLMGRFAQNEIISRVYHHYGGGNLMADLLHAEQCDKTEMNRELACTLASLQAKNDAQVWKLRRVKDEISKFCRFYKGLDNNENDPTQLSEIQMVELNKIDKMYDFYTKFYRE